MLHESKKKKKTLEKKHQSNQYSVYSIECITKIHMPDKKEKFISSELFFQEITLQFEFNFLVVFILCFFFIFILILESNNSLCFNKVCSFCCTLLLFHFNIKRSFNFIKFSKHIYRLIQKFIFSLFLENQQTNQRKKNQKLGFSNTLRTHN